MYIKLWDVAAGEPAVALREGQGTEATGGRQVAAAPPREPLSAYSAMGR